MFEAWCGPNNCGLGGWVYDYQTLIVGCFAVIGVWYNWFRDRQARRQTEREELSRHQSSLVILLRRLHGCAWSLQRAASFSVSNEPPWKWHLEHFDRQLEAAAETSRELAVVVSSVPLGVARFAADSIQKLDREVTLCRDIRHWIEVSKVRSDEQTASQEANIRQMWQGTLQRFADLDKSIEQAFADTLKVVLDEARRLSLPIENGP